MNPLRVCPGCKRHVRTTDPMCPFCAADVSTVAPVYSRPSQLTRAAIFTAALAGGCEKGPPKPTQPTVTTAPKDAAVDAAPAPVVVPPPDYEQAKPYGAPPARRRIV